MQIVSSTRTPTKAKPLSPRRISAPVARLPFRAAFHVVNGGATGPLWGNDDPALVASRDWIFRYCPQISFAYKLIEGLRVPALVGMKFVDCDPELLQVMLERHLSRLVNMLDIARRRHAQEQTDHGKHDQQLNDSEAGLSQHHQSFRGTPFRPSCAVDELTSKTSCPGLGWAASEAYERKRQVFSAGISGGANGSR